MNFLVRPDAEQRLAANDVAVPVGRTVYTALLNRRGTFESDVTIARLAADRFLLVAHGRVEPFEGDLDEYHRFLLSGDNTPTRRTGPKARAA